MAGNNNGFFEKVRTARSPGRIQVLVLLCSSYRSVCSSLLFPPGHRRYRAPARTFLFCRYRSAAAAPARPSESAAVRRRSPALRRTMSSDGDDLGQTTDDVSSGAAEEEGGATLAAAASRNNSNAVSIATTAAETPTIASSVPSLPPPPPQPLYHHWTVCVVPPPSSSSKAVWEAITEARTRLHDPGLYRWPPHVNLLYPFVDCYIHKVSVAENVAEGDPSTKEEEEESVDGSPKDGGGSSLDGLSTNPDALVRRDVLDKVRSACANVEPFKVQLRQLGTFGSSKRGVLWLNPRCFCVDNNHLAASSGEGVDDTEATVANEAAATVSPLVRLQRMLEDEFPFCTAQRTAGNNGSYRPHMTLSHFVNLEAALQAQVETDVWWSQLSSHQTDFVLDRIFVLTRRGDDGQFERVAEVRLGSAGPTCENEMIKCFGTDEGRFPGMPQVEYDWVRDQRMALKKRRNNGGGRGRRWRKGSGSSRNSQQRTSRSPTRGDSMLTPTGT